MAAAAQHTWLSCLHPGPCIYSISTVYLLCIYSISTVYLLEAGPEEFGKQSVARNYTIDTQAVDTDPVQFYYSSEMVPWPFTAARPGAEH